MSQLNSRKRAQLPKSAFAYVDSRGRRRLPINDESHVRNALARFNQWGGYVLSRRNDLPPREREIVILRSISPGAQIDSSVGLRQRNCV